MLKVDNLTFEVNEEGRKRCLVNHISFEVKDGEMLVITGPNGGGKSTLAKVLAGIEEANGGEIFLDEKNITGYDIDHRANAGIGYAFQQPPRFKGMTVRRLLNLAAGRTLSESECCGFLSSVGLCAQEYIDREADATLSGGEMKRIDEYKPVAGDEVYLLVDRMAVANTKDAISRLTDSAETAMYEGDGTCMLRFYLPDGTTRLYNFSTKFEADGITFEEPNDQMFSFNSPIGACPVCEGFGKVIGIDEHLVVPNRSLSVYEGAIVCWRGEKMGEWKDELIHNADKFDFPIFTPYYELTDEQRRTLWEGNQYFHGINDFFKMLEENQYKIQYRVMLARYRGKTICPKCHGTRLKPEAGYVRVDGKSISELVDLPITELKEFFDHLNLNEHDSNVARRILIEINSRIRFLIDVGLGYLTLNRLSNSLSGGESQRINLATSLGSSLVGSLYILDEPSIGLHSRDTDRLIRVLRQFAGVFRKIRCGKQTEAEYEKQRDIETSNISLHNI